MIDWNEVRDLFRDFDTLELAEMLKVEETVIYNGLAAGYGDADAFTCDEAVEVAA